MLTTKVENEITVELAISENISVLKFNTISNVTFTYYCSMNSIPTQPYVYLVDSMNRS